LPPWARKTPRSLRYCPCPACTASRAGTSCPRSGSSWGRPRGCRQR
jgi:hypothetical protein